MARKYIFISNPKKVGKMQSYPFLAQNRYRLIHPQCNDLTWNNWTGILPKVQNRFL
jgi:hypothetical protein